jgi:hypothetical protein
VGGSCSTYARKDLYTVLVRKPEVNRALRRPRLRREDNIKTNFQKWIGGLDWIEAAQCRGRRRLIFETGNET